MKELELTVRIRNNRLRKLRLALGLSQRELAFAADIAVLVYAGYETLARSPLGRDGYWTKYARRLALFHDRPLEWLFPDSIKKVKKAVAVYEVDASELFPLLSDHQQLLLQSPEENMIEYEHQWLIRNSLRALTPRQEKILRMRFGIDEVCEHTLEEIASDFEVQRERIRQIEAKSLRMLRFPARARALKSYERGETCPECGADKIHPDSCETYRRELTDKILLKFLRSPLRRVEPCRLSYAKEPKGVILFKSFDFWGSLQGMRLAFYLTMGIWPSA